MFKIIIHFFLNFILEQAAVFLITYILTELDLFSELGFISLSKIHVCKNLCNSVHSIKFFYVFKMLSVFYSSKLYFFFFFGSDKFPSRARNQILIRKDFSVYTLRGHLFS